MVALEREGEASLGCGPSRCLVVLCYSEVVLRWKDFGVDSKCRIVQGGAVCNISRIWNLHMGQGVT